MTVKIVLGGQQIQIIDGKSILLIQLIQLCRFHFLSFLLRVAYILLCVRKPRIPLMHLSELILQLQYQLNLRVKPAHFAQNVLKIELDLPLPGNFHRSALRLHILAPLF